MTLTLDSNPDVYISPQPYRWHGENVSTTEVAEVVSQAPGVQEVNVVGVGVPGADGRAPMAAIVADRDQLDLAALLASCKKDLPKYAVPLFLRFLPEVEITGTFKHRKVPFRSMDLVNRDLRCLIILFLQVEYKKEGADPGVCKDPLMYLDVKQGKYLPLSGAVYARIINKEIGGF